MKNNKTKTILCFIASFLFLCACWFCLGVLLVAITNPEYSIIKCILIGLLALSSYKLSKIFSTGYAKPNETK